jgi:class 3 adenylate cyclase
MRTPPRILIADDNPENLDIFQRRLAAHGYEILTATDGEEALTIARGKQPDLILLDVMMPKMDGIETCRHLKADPSLPFVPIIMVTAKTGSRDVVAGLEGVLDPLKTHRREVTVVFLDLRGFTAFAEISEPEEVMGVLREYHTEMGKLILAYEGTLERFTGDGMMIFFNDPVPMSDPEERAIHMALTMRDRVAELIVTWRKRGYELDFGVGIAQGYATIGAIGFEGRWDYGAIGTVTNLAARLCGEAKPGQILISKRLLGKVEELIEVEPVGELTLKGFHRPVTTCNVLRLKT